MFKLTSRTKLFFKCMERVLHFANTQGAQTSFFSVNRYLAADDVMSPKGGIISGDNQHDIGIRKHDNVGIVIQGPVTKYTLRSIQHYKSVFPKTKIIISTWNDINNSVLSQAESLGAVITTTEKPTKAGYLNFNFQVVSTKLGISIAEQFNLKYLMKTRSDQRINNPNAITLLKSLLSIFPAGDSVNSNARLVFCSTETLETVPLHVCDMFQFGMTSDIKKLWDLPLMNCAITREEHDAHVLRVGNEPDYLKTASLVPEIYLGNHLAKSFLNNSSNMTNTEKYNKLLKSFLVLVDKEMIQLSWPKYHAYGQLLDYNLPAGLQKMTFEKWLCQLNSN